MPRNTPKYLFTFNLDGELYSAATDLDRMTVLDNELRQLSSIIGDGVLSGWAISTTGGLGIEVSPGVGFIGNVVHRTISAKDATVFDNLDTLVYMKSTMLGTNVGFNLDVESPYSNKASTVFVDNTPPAIPSNFTDASPSYNFINLAWNVNAELDLDHYLLSKSTNNILFIPLATIPAATTGPSPTYQDTLVIGSTTYYYRLVAVDSSGNASAPANASVLTGVDTHQPAEVTNLQLYPGNAGLSLVFDGSASADVTHYLLTVNLLNPNGTIASTPVNGLNIGLSQTWHVASLTNGSRYRVSIRAVNSANNPSSGVSTETVPVLISAPLDVLSLAAVAIPYGVSLSWTASPSPTGSALGQKSAYVITVIKQGVAGSPINVGLALGKSLTSYNATAAVGVGATAFFEDDIPYVFKIVAIDAFGNQSGGVFVKSTTQNVTPPHSPRTLAAAPLDSAALITWNHSSSPDVIGYNLAVNTGAGFGPDVILSYVETYSLSGLTNGSLATIRLEARDSVGNLSLPVTTVVIPLADTIPPSVPTNVIVNPQDGFATIAWKPSLELDTDHYVVRRQHILNSLSAPANATLVVLDEQTFNVGLDTSMIDVGLVNGEVYSYSIQAVDTHGNASLYTSNSLISPTPGINIDGLTSTRVVEPTSLTAAYGAGIITVAWQHPGTGGITNFNIYRSTNEFSGYKLIGSVLSGARQYLDLHLKNGSTYFYIVTAVRDNATVVVDSGSIQPANTILLGIVHAQGGSIVSVTNSQRLIAGLQATISDETLSRLLAHEHKVKPLNFQAVEAVASLPLVDVSGLKLDTTLPLSDATKLYYQNLITDNTTGFPVGYDSNKTYVFNPTALTYNAPFIGDFQVLVNGSRPTIGFVLDANRNAITFASSLKSTDVVRVDGLGLSFYVPARIDLGFTGFDISITTGDPTPLVDEALQTLRFAKPVTDGGVVTVSIEPLVPDFGAQQGARQISLSPDIVLSDFVAQNTMTYTSQSGAFDSTDTVFVLVNGSTTSLDNFVDFDSKSIVFTNPVATSAVVSLQIKGREEVQNLLPASRIAGVDASLFSTGRFLKAQLPVLYHDGRVQEIALPGFAVLSTTDKYVYQASVGAVGTARTPYAVFMLSDGNIIIGTSGGISRTSFVPNLIVGANDSVKLDPNSTIQSGATFSQPNEIVNAAKDAESTSGRVSGKLVLTSVDRSIISQPNATITVLSPSVAIQQDGRILITGGQVSIEQSSPTYSSSCYLYDPVAMMTKQVGSMASHRIYHTCITLPTGKIMVSGGLDQTSQVCFPSSLNTAIYPDGVAFLRVLKSSETYDVVLQQFSAAADMAQARWNHSANVLDPNAPSSDVLVAGGSYYVSTGVFTLRKLFDADLFNAAVYVVCNQDTWTLHQTATSERYTPGLNSWRYTNANGMTIAAGSLHNAMEIIRSSEDNGKVVVTGPKSRELYDPTADAWTASTDVPDDISSLFAGLKIIDGPIKQFFKTSTGLLLAVTRNAVFASADEARNFIATKGLESTGVVHAVSELGGTLFAATDLGVYTITSATISGLTWFQGGLIGAGTTETFDLQPVGLVMLAATEIGVFSSPDGDAWSQLIALDNVTNIELIGTTTLFANSSKDLYRSDNSGATWAKVGTYDFIDRSAKMVSRSPLDIAFGTSTGLFYSQDGSNFRLADFDLNKNDRTNNVTMIGTIGADFVVGYDNIVLSLDPSYAASIVGQFSGVVPTVRVNGAETRNGFRYDTKLNTIVFEDKQLVNDVVDATANYSLYSLAGGGWYDQNPSGPVQVFVNKAEQDDLLFTFDARLGQFSFKVPLSKPDVVTVNIAQTTLRDAGELFHSELEDKMEMEKGLPLSLGRALEGSVLQFGLGVEHNMLERGFQRNPYACLNETLVDRSMNAYLHNAEFYVFGRRDFDRFNSTVDYNEESAQIDIGSSALVALSALEVLPTEVWVATESGVFVLNPLASFAVTETVIMGSPNNPIRSLMAFQGAIYAATRDGVYVTTKDMMNVPVIVLNAGNGLPATTFAISNIANNLIVGTNDTIYYAEPGADGAYSTWFRASFTSNDGTTQLFFGGECRTMFSANGTAYAAIGNVIVSSSDGKVWRQVYVFQSTLYITAIAEFANRIFVGTSAGVFNDDGSARSNQVSFRMEPLEATDVASRVHVNDMFVVPNDSLYVAVDSPIIYTNQSDQWTKSTVVGAKAVQQFLVTISGRGVAVSGNVVYVS